jgi:hypothetical protein
LKKQYHKYHFHYQQPQPQVQPKQQQPVINKIIKKENPANFDQVNKKLLINQEQKKPLVLNKTSPLLQPLLKKETKTVPEINLNKVELDLTITNDSKLHQVDSSNEEEPIDDSNITLTGMIENIVSPNKKNSITGSSSSQSSSTNTSPQLPIFTSDLKKMNSSTSLTKTAASAKHDSDMDSGDDNSDVDDDVDDGDDDQHNNLHLHFFPSSTTNSYYYNRSHQVVSLIFFCFLFLFSYIVV